MSDTDNKDYGSSSRADTVDDSVSLIDLITIIAKRWKFVFLLTVSIMVLTLGFLLATARLPSTSRLNMLPNKYTPTVKILLQDTSASSSLSSMLSQSGLSSLSGLIGLSAGGTTSNADLAQALLKSNIVLDSVTDEFGFVQRYNMGKTPKTSSRKKILSALKVEYDAKTGIMDLGYEDIDPAFATEVVNGIADRLQHVFKNLTMDKVSTKKLYLEEAITSAEKDLKDKASQLVTFQNKYGIYDIGAQSQADIAAVAEMQSQIRTKQIDLAVQRKSYPESDYRITMLKNQIDQLQKQIEQMKAGTGNGASSSLPMSKMTQLGAEYFNLQSDVTVQQAILSVLKQQYETTKFQEMDDSSVFQVIEKAEMPEVRSGPRRSMIAVMATVAGFFISLLLAFVIEYFEKARLDPAEARKLDVIRAAFSLRKNRRKE
jgi:tyrosine-protein kinase Etk/Wzc